MLFTDFFPRLQARALARYGVSLSEHQFTNWREQKLIPGPAHPRGRGRGLSPERHWPLQAYRRALRICWYKKRGIHHVAPWRILLWLAGEEVPLDDLRVSLQKEMKRISGQSRHLANSGYLRSGGSTTFPKAPSGDERNFLSLALDQLIKSSHLGIAPELYRDVVKLDFEFADASKVGQLFRDAVQPLMGHDITPDEIGVPLIEVWRPGYLSEDANDYVANCSEGDLILARRILWERIRLMRRLAPIAHLLGATRQASIFFVVAITLGKRSTGTQRLIDDVLRQLYEIADDRQYGRNPIRRLDFYLESLRMMEGNDAGFADHAAFRAILESARKKGS